MPSVALALEDFVPVVLTAIGLSFVVTMLRRIHPASGSWAALGTTLIVTGGLCRASWKLLAALGGPDVTILFLALYPLLAVGYLLLAMALWGASQARSGRRARLHPAVPAIIALAVLVPATLALAPGGGRILPLLWLFTATGGSIVTSLLLARWARGLGRPGIAALFLVSLAVTLGLNGLARAEVQSEPLQWAEQLLNTLNQGLFMLAALRLERATRPDAPPDVTPVPAEAPVVAQD
jgi:hypothetical protein